MVFFVATNVLLLGLIHLTVGTPCIPKVCSGASGVTESFSESAKSVSSASTSTFESSASSFSSSSGGGCSSFDSAYWQSIFQKCSGISQIERDCYLKWLATLSDSSLEYYLSIGDYFSIQEALSSDIVDYTLLQKEICAAYEYFNKQKIYEVDIDLCSQSSIFEEYAKSKLAQSLQCLAPSSPLYNVLKYSIETDYVSLPITVGFLNTILKNQATYFSSSSGSTSVRSCGSSSLSSATSSSSLSQYESILKAASIKEAEYQVYLNYLSKIGSDKMCLFTDLINYLNKDTQVFTTEMILDFANLNSELRSLYELLQKEQFFCANADWCAKEAILNEMKSKLSSVLGYMSKDCCMYTALQYCLEKEGLCYLPLFIGVSNYLLEQQSSYFSVSSSSSATVSSSSSSCSKSCSSICR